MTGAYVNGTDVGFFGPFVLGFVGVAVVIVGGAAIVDAVRRLVRARRSAS